MATTLTAVAIEDGAYAIANIGDSRAYLLRDGELRRLTRDDSLVQELVDRGVDHRRAGADATRSARSSSPRSTATRAARRRSARPRRGSATGCSSARTGSPTSSATTRSRRCSRSSSRDRAADALIDAALAAGGRDNVSVVVADTVALPPGATAWVR